MNKTAGIVIAVIAVAFLGLLTWAQMSGGKTGTNVDYAQYDLNGVISATEDNGNIADHVKGNPDAPVILVEYSDYQCSGCASVRKQVDELVEKYGDKLGIVSRTYVLSYHSNGVAAAQAAEAAALQGYWAEYGEILFANQADWFYSNEAERTTQFEDYFAKVTDGKGDMEKFRADRDSEAVTKKVDFDRNSAAKVGEIYYTPAFFIDGEFIDWANNSDGKATIINESKAGFVDYMSAIIDAKLALLESQK